MAITRAQQVRQMLENGGMLVSPSKDGKRPGYRSAKAQEVQGRTKKSKGISPGQAAAMFGTDKASTFAGMDQDAAEATIRSEVARQRNREILKEFKDKKPKVKVPPLGPFKFFKGPLQKFSDFTTARNRKFFENVIRAGKIPGLNFGTLSDLTPQELEDKYQDYLTERLAGNIDAYGNPLTTGGYDDQPKKVIIPETIEEPKDSTPTYVNPLSLLTPRIAGSRFLGTEFEDEDDTEFASYGGRIGAMGGGIMNIKDLDREAFFLGGIAKGLKKAVRGVKKLAKSPIGKAALIGAGFGLGGVGPFKGLAGLKGTLFGQAGSRVGETLVPFKEGLFTKLGLTKGGGSLMPTAFGGITLASILPLLVGKTDEEKDDILKEYYASQKLTPSTTARQTGSEFDFYTYNLAKGGTPRKEPVAKKVMPLLDMGGMEKDYRAEGGFVPIGRMEKADDVPARLSKNEFVFTADAVRNAGDGDVDKGADVMYNMMKNLEAGGEVSEESQGLDGAREMFQTSQRLGEVI
jgi:hypothetical protein